MMTEIDRCTECGKPVTRDAQQDHVSRKRNDPYTTNTTCATCNNRYLEKWDIAGELSPGPFDALLCFGRRVGLIAQSCGDYETAGKFRDIEEREIRTRGNRKRYRRRSAPISEFRDDMVLVVLDMATLLRQLVDYMSQLPGFQGDISVDFHLFRIFALKMERHPKLFLEYWVSDEHAQAMNVIDAHMKVARDHDIAASYTPLQLFEMSIQAMRSEASVFLIWLKNRTRVTETVL